MVKKTFITISVALVIALLSITLMISGGNVSATTYSAYVMGYFTESPSGTANNYALHLAYSMDCLNWIPLNQNN